MRNIYRSAEGRDLSLAGKLLYELPCGCMVYEHSTPVQCEEAERLWCAMDRAINTNGIHHNSYTQQVADRAIQRFEDHFIPKPLEETDYRPEG